MSIGRNTIVACLGIAAVLLIGHFAHWPAWATVAIAAAIAGGAWILTAVTRRRPQVWPQNIAPPPVVVPDPPPLTCRKETVTDVRLPSSRPDYTFIFAATVVWLPVSAADAADTGGLSDVARDDIVQRAHELTRQQDPAQSPLIRHELSQALSVMRGDATGRIRAMAESVQLILPEEDQRRLDKLAAMRKDEDVWAYERRREQSKRAYLSTDVLKDPGSAVVWWLARNEDQLDKAAQNIGLLAQLSRAASNTSLADTAVPPQGATSPTEHFEAFTRSLGLKPGEDVHLLLTSMVANVIGNNGHVAVAEELTRNYEAQDDPESPDQARDQPGGGGALGA